MNANRREWRNPTPCSSKGLTGFIFSDGASQGSNPSYHPEELYYLKDFYQRSKQRTHFIAVNFIIFSPPFVYFQLPEVLQRVATARVSWKTKIPRPGVISLAKRGQRLGWNFSSGSNRKCYSPLLLCQGFASVQTKLTGYGCALPQSLFLTMSQWLGLFTAVVACRQQRVAEKNLPNIPEFPQSRTGMEHHRCSSCYFCFSAFPQEGLSHYNTFFWIWGPWQTVLFFFPHFFLSTE